MGAIDRIRVAVLGASGYAGGELVRLLVGHPAAEVTYLGGSDSVGRTVGDVHPHLAGAGRVAAAVIEPLDPEAVTARAEFAFCSLPNGSSSSSGLVPALLEAGVRVVDLAGDFRLPAEAYPEWYGFDHPAHDWLDKALYGLPELFGDQIAGAALVANPGCYPTPAILGLAPLLAASLIEPGAILVDGKTGLSGAGKSPTAATTYAAVEESIRPYRFPRHQHTPEIERGIELAMGRVVGVTFVPHLVPSVRGVLVTCYARLAAGATSDALTECLNEAYASAPFVRVLPPGDMVDTKRTRGSNVVELQAVADPRTGTAILAGALDNLVKGAAGQAIQNLNLMIGVAETAGLPGVGLYP